MSGEIKKFLENHARQDGVIGQNESIRNAAVSGAVLTGIMSQYQNATPKPVYVIQDAGGNDCLQNAPNNAKNNCQAFLDKMAAGGTKKVLWMRYPEPLKSMASGSLKQNLDALMPEIEKMCRASKNPKVLWVDLRPTWGTNESYTSDGIHPTSAGSQATADAFWKAIRDSNFFDTGSVTTTTMRPDLPNTAPASFLGPSVSKSALLLSMCLAKPSAVAMRITTVSGRMVACASKNVRGSGLQTVRFPLDGVAPGVYCLEVQTGQLSKQSSLLLR
jgi:lysophospholipase L1-like esterase